MPAARLEAHERSFSGLVLTAIGGGRMLLQLWISTVRYQIPDLALPLGLSPLSKAQEGIGSSRQAHQSPQQSTCHAQPPTSDWNSRVLGCTMDDLIAQARHHRVVAGAATELLFLTVSPDKVMHLYHTLARPRIMGRQPVFPDSVRA